MRARRALYTSILLSAMFVPGCFTPTVWNWGKAKEVPVKINSVLVSDDGAIYVLYSAAAYRTAFSLTCPVQMDEQWHHALDKDGNRAFAKRYLLVPKDFLASLEADQTSQQGVVRALPEWVHPRNVRAWHYDEKYFVGRRWVEPYASEMKTITDRTRDESADPFRPFGIEVQTQYDKDIVILLPRRKAGPSAWTYPIRIMATPVALAVDTICVPLWFMSALAFMAVS